jgi:hypothetical protein
MNHAETTMEWPKRPPRDLDYRLQQVLSWRNHGPIEVYAVFAEWCEKHGVEPPNLPPGGQDDASKTIYEDLDRGTRNDG